MQSGYSGSFDGRGVRGFVTYSTGAGELQTGVADSDICVDGYSDE